jgi:hypothetical protein
VLAACASGLEPAGCTSDERCPLASRCAGAVCAADVPPTSAIRVPPTIEEFALVQLDGSDSSDPDADDVIVEHAWSVRSISAACDAPAIAGTGPLAWVRFGCPGRYAVGLVVRDALGVASAAASTDVEVRPATSAPVVIASPDLVTDHACAGEPLVCRPTAALRLSATTAPSDATLRWSVEPPVGRPLDATRRLAFLPGPDAPAPTVSIEADGTAIAGDWIFRVEARDAFGVVGAAYTRVSIGNRAPVIVAEVPRPFAHTFDADRSRFLSSGAIAYAAHDPDGDPVELSASWRHVGDGDAQFRGELQADRVTFAIEVPHTVPDDALHLIAGAELARTIEVLARDSNRAESRASLPIVVANRPPVAVGSPGDTRFPHVFDPSASRYLALASLGHWADPDGDPLTASGGAAPCGTVSMLGALAQVECAVAYDGTPAVDRIAGRHAVPLRVSDPWAAAPTTVHTIEVLNSAPVLAWTVDPATTVCWRWAVTLDSLRACAMSSLPYTCDATQFTVFPTVADPDGDPLTVTPETPHGGSASPSLAVCREGACVPFRFELPDIPKLCALDPAPASLSLSDGSAFVKATTMPRWSSL